MLVCIRGMPSALADSVESDRRFCAYLFTANLWIGWGPAEAGVRVGASGGLPVFACSSAWTSMPKDG